MTCEMPDVFDERQIKARMPHTCCECRLTIKPGTTYSRAKGIWCGDPRTYDTCLRCDELKRRSIRAWPPAYPEEGPGFGALLDWIHDNLP